MKKRTLVPFLLLSVIVLVGFLFQACAMPDEWHEVGTSGEPDFEDTFDNFNPSIETCAFRKDDMGYVHLKGSFANGGASQIVFYLPSGYRPALVRQFSVAGGGANTVIGIQPDGGVFVGSNYNTWASLDGIIFYAD